MASALDLLHDMHQRLGELPRQMVEHLRQVQPATPSSAGFGTAQPLASPERALPAPLASPAQTPLPAPARFEPGTAGATPVTATWGNAALPQPAPAASASPGVPPMPVSQGSAANGFALPASSGGTSSPLHNDPGQDEMMTLLRAVHEKLLGQGGATARPTQGRTPPPLNNVMWSDVWTPPAEGYAAGSPSMDVSTTAGNGGASSSRGLGSNPAHNRYLQPDTGTPR